MNEEDLSAHFHRLCVSNQQGVVISNAEMNAEQIQALVQAAVAGALQAQQQMMEASFNELRSSINVMQNSSVPKVEEYEDCVIDRSVACDEGLDVVKCLPEFTGFKKEYLTFRRAAENAYKVFEAYDGSVKHFQAVSIIRNKIKGSASDKLTGFGTAFNFKAIIARLDNEYGDKRPIHLLEQELSTLKQGNMTVAEYYDEVQIKLTALTNKCLMSYADKKFAAQLNDKYRKDALRVFISGLNKGICETIFSSRPDDLPAALALAEELESNRERFHFSASFNRTTANTNNSRGSNERPSQVSSASPRGSNPNYVARIQPPKQDQTDNDVSMRTVFSRKSGWKSKQAVNNIVADAAEEELREIVDDEEETMTM